MSETSSLVLFHPQIHRFSTADGHSCAELAGTGHSSASRNLDTGRPGTWSACHEPGTELHWAQSARVPSDTGTRVPSKSVTLQVPFWHCVHHGSGIGGPVGGCGGSLCDGSCAFDAASGSAILSRATSALCAGVTKAPFCAGCGGASRAAIPSRKASALQLVPGIKKAGILRARTVS